MVRTTCTNHAEIVGRAIEAKDGTDFAYAIPGVARFPGQCMRHLNGMAGVPGHPTKARTAQELKLPEAVLNLSKSTTVILVTGKTGSGKSPRLLP